MRLKESFVLRQVADLWVVLPLGEETLKFNGMIKLNESSVLLWRALEAGSSREELIHALTSQYDVDYERALKDVDTFLQKLSEIGCLE